jgi:DNA modification methylase
MRQEHSEIWAKWCLEFVELFNQGYSLKRIMKKYDTLFSWTVIAKEIIRTAEENKIKLIPPLLRVGKWEPETFKKEVTTLWEFPRRGDWCVHSSSYRGNWAPQVPRNIILQYSSRNETIMDCFLGGGTTIIECLSLGRKGIGLDISPHAINMSNQRLQEMQKVAREKETVLPREHLPTIICGDARRLPFPNDIVDLACCQPPYADAIEYTWNVKGDLSRIHDVDEFCNSMNDVASEILRVLKPGKRCAVMMGDIRRNRMIVPLGFKVLQQFLNAGFDSEEIIIKRQFQDRSSEFYTKKKEKLSNLNYRIEHEYIFVLQKPSQTRGENKKWEKKTAK